jgi:hypothetical protein
MMPHIGRTWIIVVIVAACGVARAEEPILDFSAWKQYRATVAHPSLTVKPTDIARAKENIRRYPWAKKFSDESITRANTYVERFTPSYIERMIEPTTPLSTIFTPCPACRDQGKVFHPQGQWVWDEKHPDRIECGVCHTLFPCEKYPESVVVHSSWGTPQTFSFVGGETFELFGWKDRRPSLSGCIRANKVQFMYRAAHELAEAYWLSGDIRYAQTVRLILLRLAEVYPHWLVHSGYGEIADMDPHIAAAQINGLPREELIYPPNRTMYSLHTGYWSAGRATGHGQESAFVHAVVEAYDATCETKDESGSAGAIYSDSERRTIEEKLLLESTILLTADHAINNKSVGNRSAAAMVGIALGEPTLVRFGLDGFKKTVDDWFLPDGGTPESFSYALMVFGNTLALPLATRSYSDPPGYHDDAGKRIDQLDLFHSPAYSRAWSAMIDSLQGDCTFVPAADTYGGRKIDSQWADLLVMNEREGARPQYLALLKALCGDDLHEAHANFAIYYREPGLETRAVPPLSFPDVCLPDLRLGAMRTGADGRDSLLALSASHWGGHHHSDSLNLFYWKNGQELLSDLGYLWDNPLKKMTARTLAHNTVLIDEGEQQTKERSGEVKFFRVSPHVKAMRADSRAYPTASRYERTSAIIDHGNGHDYVVDFFMVDGGRRQDFVFHGPNNSFSTQTRSAPIGMYDFKNVRIADVARLTWDLGDHSQFTAWSILARGEHSYLADGWGQRDPFNKDAGKTLPYIVRRTSGHDLKQFASVFEGHPTGEPFVIGVKRRDPWGGGVTLDIRTADGDIDTIACGNRHLTVSSKRDGKTKWKFSSDDN